ncbi:hypothetical protein CFC21_108029 [Triticum aestivum]|uniref:MATH domain-containing protein n=2 Tax=Triticum aestivum TaxID=4565 RepID=A0A9R1MHC0_WHEAT|nr:hypothetical protein CFC21_108029 [Triticum aestivum]
MTTTAYVPPSLSASSVAIVLATGSHVLRIDYFSQAAAMLANGECLKSPKFQAGGHTWRIRCYPNGSAQKYDGYVSLVLELASHVVKDVRAEFRFTLVPLRRQGWPAPAPYEHADVVTFEEKGRQFGFKNFVSRDWLEKSEKLLDGALAVRCDVTVLTKQPAPVPVVEEQELERLGLVCACKDDACKRIHAGTVEAAMALGTMPRRCRRVKEACLRLLGRLRVE